MDIRQAPMSDQARTLAWVIVIVGASLGFSLGFACATPFAALAAVAGTQLPRRHAIAAVILAWCGNQAIGYLLLHYPTAWGSFAWGGAIGLAALLAVVGAGVMADASSRWLRLPATFATAFLAYEGALLAASFVLPSEGNAFAPWIVMRIFEVNVVAYVGLLMLYRLAMSVGFHVPTQRVARA